MSEPPTLTPAEIDERFPQPTPLEWETGKTERTIWRDINYRSLMNALLKRELLPDCKAICEPLAAALNRTATEYPTWPAIGLATVVQGWRRDQFRKTGNCMVQEHYWLRFDDGVEFDPELDSLTPGFVALFQTSRHATYEDAAQPHN